MHIAGEFKYKVGEIEPGLLATIAKRVEEGERLLGQGAPAIPSLAVWIESCSSFIDVIDPLGEAYSGSLTSRWHDAKWYGGNSPKNEGEWLVVFGQYLGVFKIIVAWQG
jgi:hypothetical protein